MYDSLPASYKYSSSMIDECMFKSRESLRITCNEERLSDLKCKWALWLDITDYNIRPYVDFHCSFSKINNYSCDACKNKKMKKEKKQTSRALQTLSSSGR